MGSGYPFYEICRLCAANGKAKRACIGYREGWNTPSSGGGLFRWDAGGFVLFPVFSQEPPVHRLSTGRAGHKRTGLLADGRRRLRQRSGRERFAVPALDVPLQPYGLDHRRTVRAHDRAAAPDLVLGVGGNGFVWFPARAFSGNLVRRGRGIGRYNSSRSRALLASSDGVRSAIYVLVWHYGLRPKHIWSVKLRFVFYA